MENMELVILLESMVQMQKIMETEVENSKELSKTLTKLMREFERITDIVQSLNNKVIKLEKEIEELKNPKGDETVEKDTIELCNKVVDSVGNDDDFLSAYMELTSALKAEVQEDIEKEKEMYGEDESSSPTIEFISWTQDECDWCGSDVTIKFNGKKITLQSPLVSGGDVCFTEDGDDIVKKGAWYIDIGALPRELRKYVKELTKVINDNIPQGCCGGCV